MTLRFFLYLCGCLVFSQILHLGVFALGDNQMFVVNYEKNTCSVFTKGNVQNPNWLSENWESVSASPLLKAKFSILPECKSGTPQSCCRANNFSYQDENPGTSEISNIRKAAEFLAQKKIIEKHSFDPKNYHLQESISRKEFMKIILQLSKATLATRCEGLFSDVKNDWSCKYIETALREKYISANDTFRPEEDVSISEALKLIFQVRNIEKRYNTGFWQQDLLGTAYYIGLTETKISNPDTSLKRGEIFLIIARSYSNFQE